MQVNQLNKDNLAQLIGWSKFPLWMRNIVIAAIITLVIHLSFAFIARGTIISEFDITDSLELPFTFLYFLALFWIYPWISQMIHSTTLSKIKQVWVKFTEGLTVVVTTVILSLVLKVLPLWLAMLYINSRQDELNLAFSPDQVRRSFIIYAIIGLFFYYFVERQRIRKQLQEQQLKRTELQKEKFRTQLENLKAQVNPDFLFNSLNFLDDFIKKNPEEAEEFVNRLSNVYRSFLNRRDDLMPLQNEIEQLEDYIYIINCRFKDSIVFKINSEEKVKQKLLPPECLQILIENFITDINLKENHSLFINIYTKDKKLILEIDFHNQHHTLVHVDNVLKKINVRYSYFTEKKGEVIHKDKGIEVRLPLLDLGNYN